MNLTDEEKKERLKNKKQTFIKFVICGIIGYVIAMFSIGFDNIVALLIIGICLVVVLAFWGLIIFSNADLRKMEREEKLQKLKLKNQVLKAQSGESISNITKDNKTTKEASVAKRAAAGAIIAGETGAIIGAASAINENLKNKDN